MNKTFQGVLIAVILVAGLIFISNKPAPAPANPTPPAPPTPPVNPNTNTVVREVVIYSRPNNWDTLQIGVNYRYGVQFIRGYNGRNGAQHITDTAGGIGSLIGKGTNSSWYLFLNQSNFFISVS